MQWAWINDRSLAMRCLGVLVYGWFKRNQFSDVQQWAELALQSSSGTDDDRIRIAIAWLCALMEMDQPEPQRVEELSPSLSPRSSATRPRTFLTTCGMNAGCRRRYRVADWKATSTPLFSGHPNTG